MSAPLTTAQREAAFDIGCAFRRGDNHTAHRLLADMLAHATREAEDRVREEERAKIRAAGASYLVATENAAQAKLAAVEALADELDGAAVADDVEYDALTFEHGGGAKRKERAFLRTSSALTRQWAARLREILARTEEP